MINLLPKCTRCGSPVTDSVEYQIEQHEKIKTGNYINSEWICDDCLGAERKQEKEYSSSRTSQSNNSDSVGMGYSPIKFCCMNCGYEHREYTCPNVAQKL